MLVLEFTVGSGMWCGSVVPAVPYEPLVASRVMAAPGVPVAEDVTPVASRSASPNLKSRAT